MVIPVLLAALALLDPQASNTSSATPTGGCELHIWPAERMSGTPHLIGMLPIGRATGDEIKTAMSDLVRPSVQLAALREADVANQLSLAPGTTIVEHEEPLDRKSLNKIKSRRSSSTSPCYSELIVMDHMLIEDVVWGDRFLTIFMFRDFGDSPTAQSIRKNGGGNKLKVLTQTQSERPLDAPSLVAAAIQGNFRESAPGLRKAVTARKRRAGS